MGRITKRFAMILLCLMMIFGTNTALCAQAASAKSTYKTAVSYYRKGKYAKAQKLFNQLPSKKTDPTVKKLSKKAKTAYRRIVQKYPKSYGYYLCDIDKNGVAELIVTTGGSWAGNLGKIYTFRSGKAVHIGDVSGNMAFYYNPIAKGVVAVYGKQGYEQVYTITITNNSIKQKIWKGPYVAAGSRGYLTPSYALYAHCTYTSTSYKIDLKDLK